jgi:hypothetical protein
MAKREPLPPRDLPARFVGGHGVQFINGTAVAIEVPNVTPQHVQELVSQTALTAYEPLKNEEGTLLPGEENYVGLTRLHVALDRNAIRAGNGDTDALDRILDRTIGKPTQSVQSISMTMNYQDWINQEAGKPTEEEMLEAGCTVEEIETIKAISLDTTNDTHDEFDELAGL